MEPAKPVQDESTMTDTNQMPSDAELFRHAMAETPSPDQVRGPQTEQPAPTEQPQQAPVDDTPPRGPDGRFLPRDQAPQAPAAATSQPPDAQAQPQPAEPEGGPVPSWRHRELREQRDAIEQRSRLLEQALIDQQRQFAHLQEQIRQAQAKAEPPQIPDIIADPQAYHQHITQQHQQSMRNLEANFSFRMAHREHGELFERAYVEMIGRAERGDPSVVQAVMGSPDPGTAMINWFQRESTLAQVGNDPNAWFDKQLEERLKDQKFAGSLLERMRGSAPAAGPNGAPNVQLPPSLNRIAASAPNMPGSGDMSSAAMFDYAFRQGRR
jgi:hypothetical protein